MANFGTGGTQGAKSGFGSGGEYVYTGVVFNAANFVGCTVL